MILNNHSYCHINVRKDFKSLAESTGMKLFTNLDEDFKEVKFINQFGYIVINWEKQVVFCLGHKLTKNELSLVKDIMLYLNWLDIGISLENERNQSELKRLKRKKGVKNEKK